MTIINILSIIILLICIFLGFIVIIKNRKSFLNRIFFLITISVIIWIFTNLMVDISSSERSAFFWSQLTILGPLFLPPLILLFFSMFPNNKSRYIKNKNKLLFLFIPSILLLFFIPTKYNVTNVVFKDWGIDVSVGSLYTYFLVFFVVYLTLGLFYLLKSYRQAKNIERAQIVHVFIGIVSTIILSITTNVILLFYGVSNLASVGPLFSFIFVVSITYSIIRYRFLDIRFAIRAVFVRLLYAFSIFLALSGIFYLFYHFAKTMDTNKGFLLTAIFALSIALFGDILLKGIKKVTDRFFFQRTYSEQEILNQLARTMAESIDLKSLIKKIGTAFKEVFHVHFVTFFIFSEEKEIVTMGDKLNDFTLTDNDILIQKIMREEEIFVLDEMKAQLDSDPKKEESEKIIAELSKISGQVVLPLHGTEKITGMIILGEKKSNEAFTVNDIRSLETLSYQAGIAIENAYLYSEVQDFSKNLQKEVAKATVDLREKNRFLAILRGLDQIIMNTLDINRMCQKIVDTISWEMGYVGGLIALIDEKRHLLRAMAISQTPSFDRIQKILPQRLNQFTLSLSEKTSPLIKAILTSKEGYYNKMSELYAPVLPPEIAEKIQRDTGVKTNVVWPLSAKGKKLGVVVLGVQKEVNKISGREKELMQAFADQTGIALENASLYESLTLTNEQLARANEHLKELDKMKDEFVSIASHELRTPMTAIQGYAWMLQKGKHKARLSGRQRDYLNKIIGSTERLIALVSDMLDVSRIEGGRIDLEFHKEQLEDIIKSTIEEIRPKSLEKNIILTYHFPQKLMPKVEIDQKKIREVLLNLLGNSIKFTSPHGKVMVIAHRKGKFVQVDVKDTGRGIAREDIPKLFKKFGRLEESYAMISETSGTGLGLYISKALIDIHGGKISVRSVLGKGSTFSFTVRVA